MSNESSTNLFCWKKALEYHSNLIVKLMPENNLISTKSWLALNPLWEGDEDIVEQGLPHEKLAPTWQIMVLGEFSPTRHFKLLTGELIAVDVIDMMPIGENLDGIPDLIQKIPAPRVRRQVWLRTISGQRLAYAVSWWEASLIDDHLPEKSKPVWDNLVQLRTGGLYRDIRRIQYGESPNLEEGLGQKGPFWGRYYFLYYQRKPVTLIFEVFSPYLSKYMGRCRNAPFL